MSNIDELIAVARAATPGPWHVADSSKGDPVSMWGVMNDERIICQGNYHFPEVIFDHEFIATFNPDLVLKLLERQKKLEEFVEAFDAYMDNKIDGPESMIDDAKLWDEVGEARAALEEA